MKANKEIGEEMMLLVLKCKQLNQFKHLESAPLVQQKMTYFDCCVFLPLNGYFAHLSLFDIILFGGVLTSFLNKIKKKMVKRWGLKRCQNV